MDVDSGRRVVERFWAAMTRNDFPAAGEFLHDDYVLEWPQSGERIRGRDNFVAVNANYPVVGRWDIRVIKLVASADTVVTVVNVADGAHSSRAITFSELRDGKIAAQSEYWPDPFEAAAWRSQWVEKKG